VPAVTKLLQHGNRPHAGMQSGALQTCLLSSLHVAGLVCVDQPPSASLSRGRAKSARSEQVTDWPVAQLGQEGADVVLNHDVRPNAQQQACRTHNHEQVMVLITPEL
jgi:hypothetical protein